jgi:hypothetical protein
MLAWEEIFSHSVRSTADSDSLGFATCEVEEDETTNLTEIFSKQLKYKCWHTDK